MADRKRAELCGCASLWITGENPVDKPVSAEQVSPPHAPPLQEKDYSFMRLMTESLADGLDLAMARIEALESQIDRFVSVIDRPLSLSESIEQLRALREQIGRETK